MVNQHIQQLLSEGNDLVAFANNELKRSQEDVVTFLACNNIKRGISLYLQAFIESYQMETPLRPTPEDLLKVCKNLDARFKMLDFRALDCAAEKGAGNFCLEIGHVEECLDIAKATQNMVLQRINA